MFCLSSLDIDECADPDSCPHSARCVNMPGSYTCDCGGGFAYDLESQSCKGKLHFTKVKMQVTNQISDTNARINCSQTVNSRRK